MEAFLEARLLLSFLAAFLEHALTKFLVELVIPSITEQLLLVMVEAFNLGLEVDDHVVVLLDPEEFGFQLLCAGFHEGVGSLFFVYKFFIDLKLFLNGKIWWEVDHLMGSSLRIVFDEFLLNSMSRDVSISYFSFFF